MLFKSSVFLKKVSISYLSCGTSRHKDFWVNQANEMLKAKQVEWRDLKKKTLNEWGIFGERSLNWCSWGVEAVESGMVRIVNDDPSSSVLLWGRQNNRVVGIREDIVRRSYRWFTGDVREQVVKPYIAGMFWWKELKLMLRFLTCLLLIDNKGVWRRPPYKLSGLWDWGRPEAWVA